MELPDMRILSLRKNGEFGWGGPLCIHQFEQAVSKLSDYKWAGDGWPLFRGYNESLHDTVKRVYGKRTRPDWVIDRQRQEKFKTPRNYKIGMHLTDIHGMISVGAKTPQALVRFLNNMKYDAIFMRVVYIDRRVEGSFCEDTPYDIFETDLKPKVYFLPYSVDPNYFKPANEKSCDIAMVGSIGHRPLRRMFFEKLPHYCQERQLTSVIAPHRKVPLPRGSAWNALAIEYKDGVYVRSGYVGLLGRTRFLLFGSGRIGYPVQKYFEGMSAGCVCVADRPTHADELGFEDGKNYVETNKGNWKERLDYYIENPSEADKIAKNGRQLILEKHTHDIRAKQFMKMLEDFWKND